MKSSILTALILTSFGARAEDVLKTFCAVAHSEVAESGEMRANQFFTFDTADLTDEGAGRVEDLGTIGGVATDLHVYVTDKESHELTMQLDERKGEGASELLASTVINPNAMTRLTYRAPGSTHLIFVGCQLASDALIEAFKGAP